jgi:hypothetical protein
LGSSAGEGRGAGRPLSNVTMSVGVRTDTERVPVGRGERRGGRREGADSGCGIGQGESREMEYLRAKRAGRKS